MGENLAISKKEYKSFLHMNKLSHDVKKKIEQEEKKNMLVI